MLRHVLTAIGVVAGGLAAPALWLVFFRDADTVWIPAVLYLAMAVGGMVGWMVADAARKA